MSPSTFTALALALLAQPILGIRDEDAQEVLSQDMFEVDFMDNDEAGCLRRSVKYVAGEMAGQGRSEEGDYEHCQQRCKNTAGCAFFTWWPDRGCHLARAGARTQKVSQPTIAGPRDCRPDVKPDCFNLNTAYYPHLPNSGRTYADSPSKCYDRCKQTAGCYYYSWWEDGGCHVEGKNAYWKWAAKAVSGPAGNCIKCIEPQVQYDPDMKGSGRSQEPTQDACQLRCARTRGCEHFTFWEDGGCHLHGSGAKKKEHKSAVSGPASCAPSPTPAPPAPPTPNPEPAPTPNSPEPAPTPDSPEPAPTPHSAEPAPTPHSPEPAPTPDSPEPAPTPHSPEPAPTPDSPEPAPTPHSPEKTPTPHSPEPTPNPEPAPTPHSAEPAPTPHSPEPAPTPDSPAPSPPVPPCGKRVQMLAP